MSKLYEKLAATSPDKAFRNAETKAKLEDNKDALVGALTGGLGGAALGTLPAIAGLTARHRAKKRGSKVGKLNNRAKAIMILTPIAGATSGGFAGYNSGALSKSTKDFENHMAKVFGKEEPYKTRDAKDFRDKWNKEHGEKEGYIPSEIRTKDGKKVAFESRLFMEKIGGLASDDVRPKTKKKFEPKTEKKIQYTAPKAKEDISTLGSSRLYRAHGDLESWNKTESNRGGGFDDSHEEHPHKDRRK